MIAAMPKRNTATTSGCASFKATLVAVAAEGQRMEKTRPVISQDRRLCICCWVIFNYEGICCDGLAPQVPTPAITAR